MIANGLYVYPHGRNSPPMPDQIPGTEHSETQYRSPSRTVRTVLTAPESTHKAVIGRMQSFGVTFTTHRFGRNGRHDTACLFILAFDHTFIRQQGQQMVVAVVIRIVPSSSAVASRARSAVRSSQRFSVNAPSLNKVCHHE